jgi:glycosyltransferase involved in cell wall biosynthesis
MAGAKMRGLKVLVRDEATLLSATRNRAKLWAKGLFFRILRNLADGFLAIGRLNAEYYRSYGIAPERIFPMPYAVDNDFFQARVREAAGSREARRRQLGLEPGRPVILSTSKLTAVKGVADLLSAYIGLSPDGVEEPRPYLVYIGEGDQRESLEARARETQWDSIQFLGFKNQTELPRYYDLADVLVLASRFEPWGLVINEAMNAGRAVVVSDQVGCGPDLVRDGENGYVFPAGDVDRLRAALEALVHDPEKCRAFGEKSLEIINTWGLEADVAGLKAALAAVLP